jgi:hypothetical protein
MFRFTIRDVLWLTVVVALAIVWQRDRAALKRERTAWATEKQAMLKQRDSDVANERRLARLRELESAGKVSADRGGLPTMPSGRFGSPQSQFYSPE